MSDDKATEELLLKMNADIFSQLMRFSRFQTFMKINYDVQTVVRTDKEGNESAAIVVMEVPEDKASANALKLMAKTSPKIVIP